MIDRTHTLPLARQAAAVGISRGSVYYLPRPVPERDLTLDNRRELAGHERIAHRSQCQVFFADPYSSWQRGTNENTNGFLRQYFPKGGDFSKLTVETVNQVAARINLLPRKRLDWKTPYEVYAGVSVALMC